MNPKRLLVSLGGAGLLPLAPGTWASILTGVALLLACVAMDGAAHPAAWTALLAAGAIVCGATCVALGPWAIRHFARGDPPQVVLDEAAGMCVTLLLTPSRPGWSEAWVVLTALAAFRLCDILKPPPARQLEKLPAGWGILLDDLAAGVYANIICQLLWRF